MKSILAFVMMMAVSGMGAVIGCGGGGTEPIDVAGFCEEYADYACHVEVMCSGATICDLVGMANRCNARYACLSGVGFEVECINSLIVYSENCINWETVTVDCRFDICE